MAQLLLTVAGSAVNPIVGMMGALVGGYIDQKTNYFGMGPDDLIGPKIDQMKIQQSTEGAPINFCLGPEN